MGKAKKIVDEPADKQLRGYLLVRRDIEGFCKYLQSQKKKQMDIGLVAYGGRRRADPIVFIRDHLLGDFPRENSKQYRAFETYISGTIHWNNFRSLIRNTNKRDRDKRIKDENQKLIKKFKPNKQFNNNALSLLDLVDSALIGHSVDPGVHLEVRSIVISVLGTILNSEDLLKILLESHNQVTKRSALASLANTMVYKSLGPEDREALDHCRNR